MELFNNKPNDYLKFKLNSEGVDENKIEPRLILITRENKNYFIMGEIENGICKFDVPELTLYEKGDTGKIKFEIISEELYFPVWEEKFEIKTKSTVKIEEMISEVKNVATPKISVSYERTEPKREPKPEPKTESKKEEPKIKEPTEKPKNIKIDSDGHVKKFSNFFN